MNICDLILPERILAGVAKSPVHIASHRFHNLTHGDHHHGPPC